MVGLWEPEEAVGRWWHRWAGAAASYPSYPQAQVRLEDHLPRLSVFFRGLGGAGAIRLTAGAASDSRHRLTLRQRLGLGESERMDCARMDDQALMLPACLDCFPDAALNERLYYWLTAFFVHVDVVPHSDDPLQADIARLAAARAASARVLNHWPGLRETHQALCAAVRAARPARTMRGWEAAVEEAVGTLLGAGGEPGALARRILDALEQRSDAVQRFQAPRGYRPFLPVPLWGERHPSVDGPDARTDDESNPPGNAALDADERRRNARRAAAEQSERKDSLILYRFEALLALVQMVNLNREVEDDDPESARRAADDLDEIALARHSRRAASRLKFDLDVPGPAVDSEPLCAELSYPEWDYRRGRYHAQHCRVFAAPAGQEGEDWRPDAAARRRIRDVRRRFEALRPRRQVFYGQQDGDELDLGALVRAAADRRAGGPGSEHIYVQARNNARDLAVALLLDVSLSTDAWVNNRRVLDVEKESVLALCHGLAACGDDHGVFAFSSRTRRRVDVLTVKGFDEPLRGAPVRRMVALSPGQYTRMGAAVRHAAAQLAERPNRYRLLLLLSDGKPNDVDHYEGRYGIEDTRKAIREARRMGLRVFGITVDRKAQEYFPYVFGRGAYAIVGGVHRLPRALPEIYRQLTM